MVVVIFGMIFAGHHHQRYCDLGARFNRNCGKVGIAVVCNKGAALVIHIHVKDIDASVIILDVCLPVHIIDRAVDIVIHIEKADMEGRVINMILNIISVL